MAQVVSRRLNTAKPQVKIQRFLVEKVALGQVCVRLSEGFLCQYRFRQCPKHAPEMETADSSERKLTSLPNHTASQLVRPKVKIPHTRSFF